MMDELITRQLRGSASEFEVRQLEGWRAESPDHEAHYREMESLWRRFDVLEGGPIPEAPSARLLVTEAEGRSARLGWGIIRRAPARSMWASGLAAVALLVLAYTGLRDGEVAPARAAALSSVGSSTGAGNVTTLELSDGSVVRIAAETRIEFPATSGRREVVLEGRAFFAVAEDDEPFQVRTRAGVVTVRGTRFEVQTEEDQVRLVVVEGQVTLGPPGGGALVRAGQVAFLAAGGAPRVLDRDDVWDLLDWTEGLLIFQETPLSQVAEELARSFGRPVRVTDTELGERRVTAWFGGESLDEVVSGVCIVVGARCQVSETEVTMGRGAG